MSPGLLQIKLSRYRWEILIGELHILFEIHVRKGTGRNLTVVQTYFHKIKIFKRILEESWDTGVDILEAFILLLESASKECTITTDREQEGIPF